MLAAAWLSPASTRYFERPCDRIGERTPLILREVAGGHSEHASGGVRGKQRTEINDDVVAHRDDATRRALARNESRPERRSNLLRSVVSAGASRRQFGTRTEQVVNRGQALNPLPVGRLLGALGLARPARAQGARLLLEKEKVLLDLRGCAPQSAPEEVDPACVESERCHHDARRSSSRST